MEKKKETKRFDLMEFGSALGRDEMRKLMAGSEGDCEGDGSNVCYCYCCIVGFGQVSPGTSTTKSCDGTGGGDHDCCQTSACSYLGDWCQQEYGSYAYTCALCEPA